MPAPRRPVLRLRLPSPQAVRSAVTDTAVVTGRNLRHFIRQPDLLVFSTIQPVLFVLLFVYVFGGAISRSLPHGVAYVDFLLPGIFVQSVTFGASQTAVGLKEDLTRGVGRRIRLGSQLDLRLRRAERPGRRDGADGRVRRDLPARLCQLGVVPVATFPDWLQTFAKINPVTVTADAARSLAFYGTPASLGAAAAWIGGLLAVFIPLSVWRYRRIS